MTDLDAEFKIRAEEYKIFFKEYGSIIKPYQEIKAKLEDIITRVKNFKVIEAITVQIRMDGNLKIVGKLQHSGKTVFFNGDNNPPTTMRKVFLLSWEEKVSKKGNGYISCDSWTYDDPLGDLRKEKSIISDIELEKRNQIKEILLKAKEMKSQLITLRMLKKFEKEVGNWKMLLVIPVYVSILDSIQDKIDAISVFKHVEHEFIMCVSFKNDAEYYIYIVKNNNNLGIYDRVHASHASTYVTLDNTIYNYQREKRKV